jgi:hypothetical protein
MVRHSGFLTSLLAVLLATFSVSMLNRRSDGGHDNRRTQLTENVRSSVDLTPAATAKSRLCVQVRVGQRIAADPTLRFRVPKDSLVIVGSLDISGTAHSLMISSHPNEQWSTVENLSSQRQADLRYVPSSLTSTSQNASLEPDACRVLATITECRNATRPTSPAQPLTASPLRRFLIPHFEHDHIVQQPAEASVIADGSRVKVYADLSLADGNSDLPLNHPLRNTANSACMIIEDELLPLIERWVGRITDIDGDHRLSVVLTDLDRQKSSRETPVLGCVRRSDFLAGDLSSLAGDIIYLDQHLPPHDQLRALLAHELTHAAIFCFRHEAADDSPMRNHSVPSWLNEAAAHWVERQFCSTPAGYAAREDSFRQNPAQCPIILGDDAHFLTSRRNGSRVAGFTFLQQHLRAPMAIKELLQLSTPFDQSIATTTQASFSELFREWTIRQACETHNTISPPRSRVNCCPLKSADEQPVQRKLHGTAFLVLQSEVDQEVGIYANADAQLQITVVVHGSNRISTEYSPDLSSLTRLQSAELEIGRATTTK